MGEKNITRRINIYINGKQVENSAKGMAGALRHVNNSIRKLEDDSEGYDEKLKQLLETKSKLTKRIDEFNGRLKQTPGILGKIKGAIGPVASGMLTAFSVQGVVSAFTSKVREAWQTVVLFDQKQADLAAVMGKSRVGIAKLTLDAIKYGATTSYNASEVSDLQSELAKLGKTEKEIRNMTKAVLNSATALEAGLGPAAELIGGQLNSYSEDAKEAQRYSDVMANSVNLSATSYEYLATSLPKVSKVAYLNDVTFEKLNATMGTLADQNIAAETAGTGFRNILLAAAAAGKPYEEMLAEVNSSTDKTRKATELFGKENATVAVIMATSTEKIEANTKALEQSGGAAEKMAKEKLRSIQGSAKQFSSAWEGMILSMEKGDGVIAKVVSGFLDLGTGLLNLLTPMQQLSDEIKKEQVGLNVLVGRITSTNVTNEDRKRLLIELKDEYPDFIKNINIETASNDDLKKELLKVNDQYRQRIQLQKQVERRDKALAAKQGTDSVLEGYKLDLAEKLAEVSTELPIDFTVDYSNIEKSARELMKIMKDRGMRTGAFSDYKEISTYLENIEQMSSFNANVTKEYEKQEKILNSVQKATGLLTEEEKEKAQSLEEQKKAMQELRIEAQALGMQNANSAADEEVKKWIAAYKEKLKYSEETEQEKKAREKAENKRKKELQDRAKEQESLNKMLLESERAAQDARLDLLADGFEKEKALIKQEYDRKIQDLELQKIKESEIESLKGKLATAKKSGNDQDIKFYEEQLKQKLELNKSYSDRTYLLEEQMNVKIAALQEKYLKKEFDRKQEAQASEITRLKTEQNYELASIQSFQDAKNVLSDYLSSEELKKIVTLDQAKKKLKEEHLKQETQMQERHLQELISIINEVFAQEQFEGVKILSEEERQELLKFLDEAALKISEIKSGGPVDETQVDDSGQKAFSGLDLLGTTAEEWELIFSSLDTFEERLRAVSAVSGAMTQAFGQFFDFLDARDSRSLQKYERNSNKRKRELADQLEKGYITQEVYNARMENLELDLAKKKAEIEYKQAKRRKAFAIAQAVISTAQGVATALQGPPPASYVFAGITAAMGALQIATIASEPLPSKDGFKKGGFTGSGIGMKDSNGDEVAGFVHEDEYVIPKDVLFDDDPAMPAIMGYIEAKRKKKKGYKNGGLVSDDAVPSSPEALKGNSVLGNDQLREVIERNTAVMERLEQNGIEGFIVLDSKAAKNIKEKLKDLAVLENSAKR